MKNKIAQSIFELKQSWKHHTTRPQSILKRYRTQHSMVLSSKKFAIKDTQSSELSADSKTAIFIDNYLLEEQK